MSRWIYYLGGDSDGIYLDGVLILSSWENAHLTSDGIRNLMMSGWSLINTHNDDLMLLVMTVKTIAETEEDHNVLKMAIDQRW